MFYVKQDKKCLPNLIMPFFLVVTFFFFKIEHEIKFLHRRKLLIFIF